MRGFARANLIVNGLGMKFIFKLDGARNRGNSFLLWCFLRKNIRYTDQVYIFTKSIREGVFIGYQNRIVSFLESGKAYPFNSEYFAETIISTIVQNHGG